MLRLALAFVILGGPALAQGVPPLGDDPLPATTAAKFFDAVCLSTAPSFAGARATLEANAFAPNPETGTFYHPAFDLSFHVDTRCSMVFGSDEAGSLLGFTFAAATSAAGGSGEVDLDPATGAAGTDGPGGTRLSFGPFTAPSGTPYFRALLAPGS